jgi:hypothetical protein
LKHVKQEGVDVIIAFEEKSRIMFVGFKTSEDGSNSDGITGLGTCF